MGYYFILLTVLFISCNEKVEHQIPDSVNWKKRKIELNKY